MGDIFREIDEELRQERLDRLWKAYGKYVVAALVGAVLVYGGMRGWQEYQLKQREAESAQFAAAANLSAEGKQDDAAALFAALAERAGGAYGALARFHQAALKTKAGDPVAAVAIYEGLAGDSSVSRSLRDAARILAVMHAMDRPDADLKALADRLEPLLAERTAWRATAAELAGLLALRLGDADRARERFRSIADDADAPPNVRARAAEILAMIGG